MFEKENDLKALYAETNEDWHGTLDRRFFRPPFIHPIRCKNVRVEGVKIINSPFWTVNPEFCDNVTIKGITITMCLPPTRTASIPSLVRMYTSATATFR